MFNDAYIKYLAEKAKYKEVAEVVYDIIDVQYKQFVYTDYIGALDYILATLNA